MRKIFRKAKADLPQLYFYWMRTQARFNHYKNSDVGYCKSKFYRKFGRYPDLVDPQTYNENVIKICLREPTALMKKCVDKYEVRKYLSAKGLDLILNELYGLFSNANEALEAINDLPDKFVLKATHGCGWNFVCHNKHDINKTRLKYLLEHWMRSNFYHNQRERVYKNINPRIICERYLEDASGALRDYKFHCFKGEPKFFHVVDGRYVDMIYNTYNMSGELLEYEFFKGRVDKSKDYLRSIPIDKMIEYSRILSEDFDYVRVDFYYCNGEIYFGELTYTPGNGNFDLSYEQDRELGKYFAKVL